MLRTLIIAEARSWLGTPYRHQASLKGAGCDCLGLVRGIYRAVYGPEPAPVPTYRQFNESGEGERLIAGIGAHLQAVTPPGAPGDVLVFRLRRGLPARHCAVLVEPLRFIHSVSGHGVALVSLTPWWSRRLVSCFAFPQVRD